MVLQSFGALRAFSDPPPLSTWPTSSNAVALYGHTQAYATIYATQPNVRTCVDFLARNIAELTLQVFRRVSDTDRERLVDHELVDWLDHPNPTTRRYRLFESLVGDLGIYFNACWLKVPDNTGTDRQRIGLVRIPPEEYYVNGGLLPTSITWTRNGRRLDLTPDQVVRYDGYNPLNPLMGLSPLETLRRVLAEELAAGENREAFWRNASRTDGIIERPLAAPKWSDPQKKMWREQWQQRFAGNAGAGMVPVLEDGMTYKPAAFSPRDAEYTAARKLTREECAAAYHIPLPMVGILEHATFCLPADAEVFTEDGPRAIADVRVGDYVWSLTDAGTWTRSVVRRAGCTGQDEILTLRTLNRTIRLNARHRVLARCAVWEPAPIAVMSDGHRRSLGRAHKRWTTAYVPAGELRVGDTIVGLKQLPSLDGDTPPRLPSGRVATIGFLELGGLLLGDGNVTRVHGEPVGLQIARADGAPYMEAYRVTMGDLLGADVLPDTRGPLHLIEGGRQTRLMSVAVGREFDRLGFSGTARTKRVPGWVFGLPEAYRLALLRGFLDADGSCDRLGRLSFSSCSRPLLSQIRHLCLSVGVPVTNLREQRGQTRLPTGRLAAFSQWHFTCADPGANRRIGSHTPEYQRRLAAGRAFGRKTSRYPWQGGRDFASETTQLSAIRQIDRYPIPEPVYDLEVEGTHSFIADGVVVHNSNIKEQHKHLYQDCLGPWLRMIKEEIQGQLLIECADQRDIYTEFNIDAKLAGTFEERAVALKLSIGRAWLTVNEGRALENLPRIDDPEMDTVAPQQGGPSDASAQAPPPGDAVAAQSRGRLLTFPAPDPTAATAAVTDPVLRVARARLDARLSKVGARARPAALVALQARWTRELAVDLSAVIGTDAAATLAAETYDAALAQLVADAAAGTGDGTEGTTP